MSTRLVLLGPPGAGKGTQAARLAERLAVPAISTGDIFRANIKGGTELGRKAQEYSSRGALVPDEITNAMVRDRLAQDDAAGGFLLDGYPRNVAQVAELDAILADAGLSLDLAVEITADPEVVAERLLKRAEIEGREDDTEDVIRHRLDVYAEQTAPISDVYSQRGLLARVDGIGEVDEVTERLLVAIGSTPRRPGGGRWLTGSAASRSSKRAPPRCAACGVPGSSSRTRSTRRVRLLCPARRRRTSTRPRHA